MYVFPYHHCSFFSICMTSWLNFVSISFCTGSTFGVNIDQKPSISLMPITKSVTLECQHDDKSHYYLFWYKQNTNGDLGMIAYSVGEDNAKLEEPFNSSKYTFNRQKLLTSSLEIKDLESADTATYFCATSAAQCYTEHLSSTTTSWQLREMIWSLIWSWHNVHQVHRWLINILLSYIL